MATYTVGAGKLVMSQIDTEGGAVNEVLGYVKQNIAKGGTDEDPDTGLTPQGAVDILSSFASGLNGLTDNTKTGLTLDYTVTIKD